MDNQKNNETDKGHNPFKKPEKEGIFPIPLAHSHFLFSTVRPNSLLVRVKKLDQLSTVRKDKKCSRGTRRKSGEFFSYPTTLSRASLTHLSHFSVFSNRVIGQVREVWHHTELPLLYNFPRHKGSQSKKKIRCHSGNIGTV